MPIQLILWLTQGSSGPPGPREDPTADVVFWCSVLMLAVVLLFLIATLLKKRSEQWRAEDAPSIKVSFTLDDVRQMREAGQLTDEEAERMRAKIIARSREGIDTDAPPPPATQAAPTDQPVEGEATDVAEQAATQQPPLTPATPTRSPRHRVRLDWLRRRRKRPAGPQRPPRKRRW